MNCEYCESRLLDLLYEDLTTAEEAEVRGHVRGCERCAAAFARLSAGHRAASQLPLLSPSPAVLGNILQAARAHAAGHPDDAPPRAAHPEPETPWRRILEFVRDFATGPQAAMATVMLLVVAIGVWYLPESSPLPDAAGTTVMSPALEGEAAPTLATVPVEAPAAELAEVRPEPRRTRSEPAPSAPPEPMGQLAQARPADSLTAGRGAASGVGDERARAQRRAPGSSAERSAARPSIDALAGLDDGRAEGSAGAPAGGAVASSRVAAAAPSPAAPSPAPSAPPAAVADAEAELRVAAPPSEEASGAGAVDEASIAESVHRLARAQRAAGQCASAVRHYESLLGRFPSYAGAPQAMVEVADCYERMGRFDLARRWLTRARGYAATRAVAMRELDRLDDAEAASARRASEAAAAPSAE